VDSAVEACGEALDVARSGVLAEVRDLRKALKADRIALAGRHRQPLRLPIFGKGFPVARSRRAGAQKPDCRPSAICH